MGEPLETEAGSEGGSGAGGSAESSRKGSEAGSNDPAGESGKPLRNKKCEGANCLSMVGIIAQSLFTSSFLILLKFLAFQ